MVEDLRDFEQWESKVLALNPSARGCRSQICDLRQEMDAACASGEITVGQWRTLLDQVASVQAKHVRSF
jgi:hypothetical protein